MDSKTANLDPKLKEAYERIMGTTVPTPAQKTSAQTSDNPTAKPVQTPPPQAPKLQVQEVAPEPLEIPKAQPPLPPPPQQQSPSNEMVQSPVFNPTKNPFINPFPPPANILGKDTNTILDNDSSPKKKSMLKSILLALGGLIFFVVYGVIWAKVFNLF